MRELRTTNTLPTEFGSAELLYQNKLIAPSELNKSFTWLYGRDKSSFPLLTLTEGNGATKSIKPKEMNDTQYTWKTFGRPIRTSRVIGLVNTLNVTPGKGPVTFEVYFEDNLFHNHYGLYTPDGQCTARVQGEGVLVGVKKYKYRIQLMTGDKTAYIALDNFLAGKAWTYGPTSIPLSKSDGTTSNTTVPGLWTNQFGAWRYSYPIAGNIANKAVIYEFDATDQNGNSAGKTNLWLPFQMKMWEIERRELIETDLWESEYNRTAEGVILNTDDETGEVVPKGAGVKSQIKAIGNWSTYGNLSLAILDKTVLSVLGNRQDKVAGEVVLYTGKGGLRMINKAIMNDAKANQFFTPLGAETISGGDYLSYGKYFNQYKTIDGWILTIKTTDYFDHSLIAQMQIANGQVFEGLPYYSYNLVSLDHSMSDDGERNIQFVCEKGREYIANVYKGMAPLPGAWGSVPDNLISTKKDVASYEVMGTLGIGITNPTTSFWLEFQR